MEIRAKQLTTSGPKTQLSVFVDPDVVAAGTVFVSYKSGSTYTTIVFTQDGATAPTQTKTTGLSSVNAATAYTDWQALQP